MPLADELHLHRLQYRQGQTLLGEDLNSQAAAAEQLRWWHNRAMHGAFGVVAPFNPVAAGPAGAVTVHPFIAYDCFGRELVLPRPRRVPLPPKPDLDAVPAVHGTPFPQGHKVLKVLLACRPAGHECRGRVSLVWVDRRDYRPAVGVPLAVALSGDGRISASSPSPTRPPPRSCRVRSSAPARPCPAAAPGRRRSQASAGWSPRGARHGSTCASIRRPPASPEPPVTSPGSRVLRTSFSPRTSSRRASSRGRSDRSPTASS